MAVSKSPAYQWYPKDILASARVAEMDMVEECAYRRALDFCWLNHNLPADPAKLARIIGKGCTSETAAVVAGMFMPHPGDPARLIHDRLEAEREKQAEWSRKSSDAGKESARLRAEAKRAEKGQKSNQISTTVARLVQPPLQGWLPNGTNQNPTLQSSSPYSEIEREAHAQDFSSEAGSKSVNQGTPPPELPARPRHAPTYEQALEYFQRQGVPEMTDAFMVENDKAGWIYRDGREIANWPGWAAGFIRAGQKAATKAAEKEAKKPAKKSKHVLTRDDFYTEREWQQHLQNTPA